MSLIIALLKWVFMSAGVLATAAFFFQTYLKALVLWLVTPLRRWNEYLGFVAVGAGYHGGFEYSNLRDAQQLLADKVAVVASLRAMYPRLLRKAKTRQWDDLLERLAAVVPTDGAGQWTSESRAAANAISKEFEASVQSLMKRRLTIIRGINWHATLWEKKVA